MLSRLFALRRFGVRPGLDVTRNALAAVRDPHLAVRAIHVAGTNGKGSTAAMIESMLRASGLRTGLYTSPHLCRFTERIRIGGHELDEDEAAVLAGRVLAAAPDATFFEVATVMAFLAFRAHGVDVAVLETGLGGRLDSTNVIEKPLVTVVTGIARDHAEVLGDTLAAIAREKAGILKPGAPAVIGCDDDEPRQVLLAEAARIGAPVHLRGRDFPDQVPFPVGLAGVHQQRNGALALRAVELATPLSDEAKREGLARVRWPGRFEFLTPDVLADAAHNPDGARALAAALPTGRPITLIFGAVDDKDAAAMLSALAPRASRVILTRPPSPRATGPAKLLAYAPKAEIAPDLAAALALAGPGLTLITGSIFLIGQARHLLLGEPMDPITAQDPPARKNL
jgi:dihydrofolate synthase/folylpolyglutamate synthase